MGGSGRELDVTTWVSSLKTVFRLVLVNCRLERFIRDVVLVAFIDYIDPTLVPDPFVPSLFCVLSHFGSR
jgi:hypothetical protein